MTQEDGQLDSLVRKRIRALRVAQGWSLEELATRANLSQSSLSRIENGQRRLALDQLVTLARALDTTLDQLVENAADDVVISPMIDGTHGLMRWPMKGEPGMSVMRQRMTEPPPDNPARMRAHPGREWLVVLSGTAILMLAHHDAARDRRRGRAVRDHGHLRPRRPPRPPTRHRRVRRLRQRSGPLRVAPV
jgi:transcriptional regulator with XRE-family HTH domain